MPSDSSWDCVPEARLPVGAGLSWERAIRVNCSGRWPNLLEEAEPPRYLTSSPSTPHECHGQQTPVVSSTGWKSLVQVFGSKLRVLTARTIRDTAPTPDRPVRVGMVQINNSFSGQNYFPYSVGILQAFAQKHLKTPAAYEFQSQIYKRMPVPEAVARLEGAEVIFFSSYVWNIRISLAIAKQVKQLHPETLIVFGGPQVPDRGEEFIRDNPFIDVVIHGEGEQVTVKLLEEGPIGNWDAVPSISYVLPDGKAVHNPMVTRLKNLSEVPSPYMAGVFDRLIQENPDERWIVMWETNRGCPFSCTFCDWGSATASKVSQFELDRLFRELDWFADHNIEFIFCCDANFGMLPRDQDIVEYAAGSKKNRGYPKALSVQNTKNATERAYKVQKTLAEAGLNKGVTISFQSVDPGTLEAIKRNNISTDSFQSLQRRFTADGIETYSDLILGLPGETYHTFVEGVSSVIENGQHNRIQFNNLSILPNAEMGDPEYQKLHAMTMVTTKVVNIHGALTEAEWDVPETQELVIATRTMPKPDWVRTRAFCWWAALLHFDKLLQMPLVVVREQTGCKYRELFEQFTEGDLTDFPTLSELRDFFWDKAHDIQTGGAEYVRSEEWLNIWWPADEYAYIKLTTENKLDAFYEEAGEILSNFLKERDRSDLLPALADAVKLNTALLKRPFQTEDIDIDVDHNVWEFYKGVLFGKTESLERRECRYHIDRSSQSWFTWDDWCKEVVWYGNKKGAYLYNNRPAHREIAGHF